MGPVCQRVREGEGVDARRMGRVVAMGQPMRMGKEEEGGLLLSRAERGREGGMSPSGLFHFPNLFPFPRFVMHLF